MNRLVGSAAVVCVSTWFGCANGACSDKVIQELPSQQLGTTATVVQMNCGASSTFTFFIAILHKGESPRDLLGRPKSVFMLRDTRRTSDSPPERLRIGWLSPDSLSVEYDGQLHVLKRVAEARGIRVTYRTW